MEDFKKEEKKGKTQSELDAELAEMKKDLVCAVVDFMNAMDKCIASLRK